MKILIIEDDLSVVTMLTALFMDYIPRIEIATAPYEAGVIEAIEANDFEVVILDGDLRPSFHARDVIKLMDKDVISKTIVFSGEDRFILEAKRKGIVSFSKSQIDELLEEVIRRTAC